MRMPPFLLAGAVTPVYSNNPSFRTVSYYAKAGHSNENESNSTGGDGDRTGDLLDWTVYYAPIQELDVDQRRHTPTIDTPAKGHPSRSTTEGKGTSEVSTSKPGLRGAAVNKDHK